MSSSKSKGSVITAGLALFSMFFGAGDLLWPLILGANSGQHAPWAVAGLIITGVSLPLLGLISMMLFEGDYRAFFNRLGVWQGAIILFVVQAILGPLGSIPRLITLCHGTMKPYLPELSLMSFSLISSAIFLILAWKKSRIISVIGLGLTPILLTSLFAIFYFGFQNPPAFFTVPQLSNYGAFGRGLSVGYNTLDLVASFLFAPLVLNHFASEDDQTTEGRQRRFGKMVKASLFAAAMLSLMYIGLCNLAARYTPLLGEGVPPEEMLSRISQLLLGEKGAIISSLAIAFACLTTAVPLISIAGEYLQKDLLKGKGGHLFAMILPIILSCAIANLGFIGIANMLEPVLKVICPGLIVLSILNIIHKLYEMTPSRTPVFLALGLSSLAYLIRI